MIKNFLDKVHDSGKSNDSMTNNPLKKKKSSQICTSLLKSSPFIKKSLAKPQNMCESAKESLHHLKTLDRQLRQTLFNGQVIEISESECQKDDKDLQEISDPNISPMIVKV